jgi:hypothetical protein
VRVYLDSIQGGRSLIPGGLVLLQPIFWFSLSLLTLGAILGAYPAYLLDGLLRKAKKKQQVAYKALSQVNQIEVQEHQVTKSLQKPKSQLLIKVSDLSSRTLTNKLIPLVKSLGSNVKFKLSWQLTGFFRMFIFVLLVFVGLLVFQVQRQLHSFYGIPFLRDTMAHSGGELLVEWFKEIAMLPHTTYYWTILMIIGFIWSLFGYWFRTISLSIYVLTLVLVIQSLGSFSQGDPLRVDYVGITPGTAAVIVPLNQSLLKLDEPMEFGRVLFEGFQIPQWTISLGIPSILVRSFRIDFGEPGLMNQGPSVNGQNQSSGSQLPLDSNGPKEFVLNEASQPRPLVGSVSSFGLDVIGLVNSFFLPNPFARRSGFLSPFDDPEGVVIFDRGHFTLVLSPGIR